MTDINPRKYGILCWPYISSTCSVLLAYKIQHLDLKYRWFISYAIAKGNGYMLKSFFKEWKLILPAYITDYNLSVYWLMMNMTFSMLQANQLSALFGGQQYFLHHGIDSYKKALISSLCSGQVYFRENKNARKKALKRLLKIATLFGAGYAISKCIQLGLVTKKQIETNSIFHMELLGLLLSITVFGVNIPSNLHLFIFGGNDEIDVIEPYDFVYLSKSLRGFWKNWSRPGGELLRFMVYKPLGGRDNFWISVPALFAMNCLFHYNLTFNLYGYKDNIAWNKAFFVMGTGITLFIFTENISLKYNKKSLEENVDVDDQNSKFTEDIYWKIWSFGLFHASMATTLYILKDKAVRVNLQNVCNTYLGEMTFNI
eukprot:408539_1